MIHCRPLVILLYGILFWLNSLPVRGQLQTLGFTHFGTSEGLSHSNVYCLVQDHEGFMWFGTLDGLNKFDGYRFTVYKKDPDNTNSLSANHISAIKEDKAGNLWIATRGGGLNRLDRRRNRFTRYQHQETNPNSLSNDFISSIQIDRDGYIWLTTEDGLNRFDPRTQRFIRFLPDPNRPGSINDNLTRFVFEDSQQRIWVGTDHGGLNLFHRKTQSFSNFQQQTTNAPGQNVNSITTILEDNTHQLWVGTRNEGLSTFDPQTRQFTSYLRPAGSDGGLSSRNILSLAKDQRGHIWVGTDNEGLHIYNPDIGVFTRYQHDEVDQSSLTNNSIYALFPDRNKNMWLGIYAGGVNLVNKDATLFTHFKHTSAATSLNNNTVLAFFEDPEQNIWIGTDGGGMSLFDHDRKTFTPFTADKNQPDALTGNYVLAITQDSHRQLWIGTWNDGLSVYDKVRKSFKQYRHVALDSTSLSGNNVYSILMDRNQTMWVATWDEGLNRYDPAIDGFRHYKHDPANINTIASNALHYLIQDRRGYIWIATANAGVDRFDPKTQRFAHFTHRDNVNSVSTNNVTFLYEDRAGNIWMTTTTGLSCYNPLTNTFTNYLTKDGLPNDVIDGILEDKIGNFWISTNGGLSRFDPKAHTFQNFTVADGLQASEFKQHACLQSRSGLMYFGGSNGFNVFDPTRIRVDHFDPPLLITNLLILNKEVPVALTSHDTSPLTNPIWESNALTLPYRSSVITFEFASLNYTLPAKKQYAYRLKGFDKDWNYVGTTRTATYTNLDPGQYTFQVKGFTNQGGWSARVRSLSLTIEAPYWLTWWFKLLIILAIAGITFWFYQLRINAVNAQKQVLEQVLVERTERLFHEQMLNKMKSQFVSTASHEFRTPLATIQSSVDLVAMYLDNPSVTGKAGIQKHLTIIEKEIDKFGDLLNDVLSIEKMNAGKVVCSPQLIDVAQVYTDIITSHFQTRKDGRCVEVRVTGTPRPVPLDEKLISHALTNLLSNAFKYSATNPVLHVAYGESKLKLVVSDQGMGIPKQDIPHLFETFYRAGNVSSIQGTGLGLFIARQFVELHSGSIAVDSQEDVGTTFTITLPARPAFADASLPDAPV